MGVPPMKHGQDARATLADKGFCKPLLGFGIWEGVDAAHRTVALFEPLRGRNKARMALETLMRNL